MFSKRPLPSHDGMSKKASLKQYWTGEYVFFLLLFIFLAQIPPSILLFSCKEKVWIVCTLSCFSPPFFRYFEVKDWCRILVYGLELTTAANHFGRSFLLLVKSTYFFSYTLDVLLHYPSCAAIISLRQGWERGQNPGHDWLRLEGLPIVHSAPECCKRGIVRWCQSSADWKEHWWSVS